jgi:hypothetical protein
MVSSLNRTCNAATVPDDGMRSSGNNIGWRDSPSRSSTTEICASKSEQSLISPKIQNVPVRDLVASVTPALDDQPAAVGFCVFAPHPTFKKHARSLPAARRPERDSVKTIHSRRRPDLAATTTCMATIGEFSRNSHIIAKIGLEQFNLNYSRERTQRTQKIGGSGFAICAFFCG